MVVLDDVHAVGKAARAGELDLVFGLVLAVAAAALRLPENGRGQRALARQLGHIVHDAVFVEELRLFEPTRLCLVPEPEGDPGVHHRLALHHVGEVLRRDGDVREHVQVGKPAGAGAGFSGLALGQGRLPQLPHDLAPLKVQGVFKAAPPDGDVHVPGGVLGGAGTQSVEP